MTARDVRVERRIRYQYGVNPPRWYAGFRSFVQLRQEIERSTSGPIQVDAWEARRVEYGEWIKTDEVCPFEDCPSPVIPGDEDCGNHEESMT